MNADNAHAPARNSILEMRGGKGEGLDIAARTVVCIASTGHERIQGERDVGGRAAERTDLVKRISQTPPHRNATRFRMWASYQPRRKALQAGESNRRYPDPREKCCHAEGDRRGRTPGDRRERA